MNGAEGFTCGYAAEQCVTVIGAGLAGCEAAFQLASRGIKVRLVEMKPKRFQPAHKLESFAELVCSNSFRADSVENAVGLLKEEMRRMGSLIMRCADETRVPAGGALAVDRQGFSNAVTRAIASHPNITVVCDEAQAVPEPPCIIATGPLTEGALLADIERLTCSTLHFHDAAAPIVSFDSVDMSKAFTGSRYGKGSDYINCPMDMQQYYTFVRELQQAETVKLHEFETPRVFEGCMPVEVMAKRGDLTLAYGPLKPVGFTDPATGKRPFAVVQLRRDNAEGTLYNMVGFQTNLKFAEQKRVFGLIPGLENAEFIRYGVMHRNSYIDSPGRLNCCYGLVSKPGVFFAGQITGVEGYLESASSGFVAGVNMAKYLKGEPPADFTRATATGALAHYVAEYNGSDFQPMNVTFGIMEELPKAPKNKRERCAAMAARALDTIDSMLDKGVLQCSN